MAKVLLNALYLQSQGKLQNGPGYIRAGIEDGYDLLPQVANRLESRRRELRGPFTHRRIAKREQAARGSGHVAEEEAAINLVIEQPSSARSSKTWSSRPSRRCPGRSSGGIRRSRTRSSGARSTSWRAASRSP